MTKITYIEHSAFSVERGDVQLIFDYYKGEVPEFEEGKKVIVFSSHVHYDHFDPCIFEWAARCRDITYVLSSDIQNLPEEAQENCRICSISPGEELVLENGEKKIKIHALRSTDEGVAFLVEVDGQTFYHAGDLNWWHWEGETEEYNRLMKEDYQREIRKIGDCKIKAAFVPVDPRLERQYYWGIDWYMKHTDTEYVFPMHMQGEYGVYDRLMVEPDTESYRSRIQHVETAGQVFEFPEKERGTRI